jgi:hypothetical protein
VKRRSAADLRYRRFVRLGRVARCISGTRTILFCTLQDSERDHFGRKEMEWCRIGFAPTFIKDSIFSQASNGKSAKRISGQMLKNT